MGSLQSLFRRYRVFIRRNLDRKCRILRKTVGFPHFPMFSNGFPIITRGFPVFQCLWDIAPHSRGRRGGGGWEPAAAILIESEEFDWKPLVFQLSKCFPMVFQLLPGVLQFSNVSGPRWWRPRPPHHHSLSEGAMAQKHWKTGKTPGNNWNTIGKQLQNNKINCFHKNSLLSIKIAAADSHPPPPRRPRE